MWISIFIGPFGSTITAELFSSIAVLCRWVVFRIFNEGISCLHLGLFWWSCIDLLELFGSQLTNWLQYWHWWNTRSRFGIASYLCRNLLTKIASYETIQCQCRHYNVITTFQQRLDISHDKCHDDLMKCHDDLFQQCSNICFDNCCNNPRKKCKKIKKIRKRSVMTLS